MMPSMGFVVSAVDQPRSIVSPLEDGTTSWCLGLYPAADGTTRLISRGGRSTSAQWPRS
jgi:hypothetical protein